ncbi:MAG TPA: hypothetical protein VF065_10505 [Ilumatobacter sp.]
MIKLGGLTTVVVATATAACGLLMLSGAGPTPAAADDEIVPQPPAVVPSSTDPQRQDSEEPLADPTSTTSSTTTTTNAPAPPIPLGVAPPALIVGIGGTARISGECPMVDGAPLGPVEIWQIGSAVTPIATGVTAAAWSYDWTAPTAVEPLVLQVWCGDPSQYQGGYPESLQIEVVFVAQEAPTTTTVPVVVSPPHEIPETG